MTCFVGLRPVATLQWTVVQEKGHALPPRAGHSSVCISCTLGSKVSTYIVVFGGYNGTKSFGDILLFDTGKSSCCRLDSLNFQEEGRSLAIVKILEAVCHVFIQVLKYFFCNGPLDFNQLISILDTVL